MDRCSYVGRAYFFYVAGIIPEQKDLRRVDERIVEKYAISSGKATRARRKTAGFANLQYLRFRRMFVLLATRGRHRYFEEECRFVRDVREHPIKFGGYSVSHRNGHPHVRIEQSRYLELKAFFSDLAIHRSKEWLEGEFRRLPFEPYAPIRAPLHSILREVNRRRELARFEAVSASAVRVRRRVAGPFEDPGCSEPSLQALTPEQCLKIPRAVNDS
jgi:hypothetical protein